MISSRDLYRKSHPAEVQQLALLINESWFQRAVAYTRASLLELRISPDQAFGVDLFLKELTALTEEEKPVAIMPDKSDLPSYERPGMLPPEKPEGD